MGESHTTMNPKLEYQIYKDISTIYKIYPTFTRVYLYDQPLNIRQQGYEVRDGRQRSSHYTGNDSGRFIDESLRRSKTNISDLILSNNFDLFVTFTFSTDRQNIDLLKKKMSKWLKNQREIHGRFDYLILPEFHSDKKSIHFHGLFKNYQGQLKEANTKRKRKTYNIKSYRLGFSLAEKIEDIQKISSYVKKYITKDMPQFDGKKRYWCSKHLTRPIKFHDTSPQIPQGFQQIYKLKHLTMFQQEHKVLSTNNIYKGEIWPKSPNSHHQLASTTYSIKSR